MTRRGFDEPVQDGMGMPRRCANTFCFHPSHSDKPDACPVLTSGARGGAEGCDIGHLMQGVGRRGLTSLFQNLCLLAWAVTLADALTLAAPWIEASPVFTFVSERVSHEAAHTLLGAEKLLARLIR